MTVAQLKELGFDLSYMQSRDGFVKVRCSQCEAMTIQGVPCHEHGCPNKKKERDAD
jgi:hypothetical protein